eukprot:5163513-Heterocapsa_arctica.AAC.1
MEQAVRVHCIGESPCSMKWPSSGRWGNKLKTALTIVKAAKHRMKEGIAIATQNIKAHQEKTARLVEP